MTGASRACMSLSLFLGACAGPTGDGASDTGRRGLTPYAIEAGVAALVYDAAGAPQPRSISRLGGRTAQADAGGLTLYIPVAPGRIPVQTEPGQGEVETIAVASVMPSIITGVQLHLLPAVPPVTVPTMASGGRLSVDDVIVDFAPETVRVDGQLPQGGVDWQAMRVSEDEEHMLPNARLGLLGDDELEAIDLYTAFYLAPAQPGVRIDGGEDRITVSLPVPDALAGTSRDDLWLYGYDELQTYWTRVRPAVIEGDRVVGPILQFGWMAFGAPRTEPLGCLVGSITAPGGEAVPGAELMVTLEDHFGVLRAYADDAGRYCLDLDPGLTGQGWAFGVGEDTTQQRYRAQVGVPAAGAGSCATSCTTTFDVPMGAM